MSKTIGRVLSLSYPMPGVYVDNYTFLSAPSLFDYDAVIVDQAATGALIDSVLSGESEAASFTGAPVRPRREASGDVPLLDVLRRRHGEAARLLDNGGAIVVFAHPPRQHALCGERWASYDWLPDAAAATFAPPALLAGEGAQAAVVDWQAPLAPFVASQLANIAYRAHFDLSRIDGARAFARSYGGAVIAAEIPLPRGRLFAVPALRALPAGDARYAAAEAMLAGIRHALDAMAPGHAPPWIAAHPLPGLDQAREHLEAARGAATAAADALAAAEAAHAALARMQGLLWQEGRAGLTPVVLDALRALGAEVFDRDANELELRIAGTSVLCEIDAADAPVDMSAHHRLRQRIESAIERRGGAPRGVLFVNGERLLRPEGRAHVTPALHTAAETMRYCIAPTAGLFDAYVASISGDEARVAAYLESLLTIDGVLDSPR